MHYVRHALIFVLLCSRNLIAGTFVDSKRSIQVVSSLYRTFRPFKVSWTAVPICRISLRSTDRPHSYTWSYCPLIGLKPMALSFSATVVGLVPSLSNQRLRYVFTSLTPLRYRFLSPFMFF